MSEPLDLDAIRARTRRSSRWLREDVTALLAEVDRLRAQVAAPDAWEEDPVWALLREAESLPYTKQAIEPGALRAALATRPAPTVNAADVDGLSLAIRAWHDATFPGKTTAAVALKLAEEAGEVAGAQVRCDEIAAGHRTGEPTAAREHLAREHLAKELGDLAIVWLTLSARHDLAPEAVVRDRWATVQNRRWTTEPATATPVGTKRPCARPGFEEMWDGDRWVPICLGCGDEAAYCDGTRHAGLTVTNEGVGL